MAADFQWILNCFSSHVCTFPVRFLAHAWKVSPWSFLTFVDITTDAVSCPVKEWHFYAPFHDTHQDIFHRQFLLHQRWPSKGNVLRDGQKRRPGGFDSVALDGKIQSPSPPCRICSAAEPEYNTDSLPPPVGLRWYTRVKQALGAHLCAISEANKSSSDCRWLQLQDC